MKCRLASLQPACLLARSLAINCLFGCLRTHLFGCICPYSLLVLYVLSHSPLSSPVMMHSAKEKHHLRGLCFSFHGLELSACQPSACLLACLLARYKLLCLLACIPICLVVSAVPIQLACTLFTATPALEFTRDDAFSKRESSLAGLVF